MALDEVGSGSYPALLLLAVQLYFFLQIWWWVDHNPSRPASCASSSRRCAKRTQGQYPAAVGAVQPHLEQPQARHHRLRDANFSDHDGVDWEAMQKAYEKNNKKHKVVSGGSTITQQLAKNLFLSGSRSYLRKGQELIITFMLESLMDKERIFEIYLNVVEFGTGTFGAEAAARHYYGVSAANLSAVQAAKLAVMLPNPRFFDKHRDSNYLAAP
jgi:monofunctional biosynthetic peptidoglycan transglycosylase